MSYFGVNGSKKTPRAVIASHVREEDSNRRKVYGLEREYKENTSAISGRQKRLRESLLAYTQRLQALTRNRFTGINNSAPTKEKELIVRASRIRRKSNLSSENGPRKILSLNELLNRPHDDTVKFLEYQKHHSSCDKTVLPIIDSVIANPEPVALANAYDLKEVCTDNGSSQMKHSVAKSSSKLEVNSPEKVKTEGGFDTLPPIEQAPPRRSMLMQHQPTVTSPRDIYIILGNNKTDSRMNIGNDLPVSHAPSTQIKSRKRRKSGNRLLYKRMKLPSGILDSIPEIDDDKNVNSAGTNRTRQRATVSRGSPNKPSVYINTSFLPNLVSPDKNDLTSTIRVQRKREWKIHDDHQDFTPPKRPNSTKNSRDGSSKRENGLGRFTSGEEYPSSVQKDKSNSRKKNRNHRLIFLTDSQRKT